MSSKRQNNIKDYLFQQGITPVQELANSVGTSLATVRRDLNDLERAGIVERLHGSARIARAAQREAAFEQREAANLSAKRAIANAAFHQVDAGSFIFLDAGTTVLQLARKIAFSGISLSVATNGLVIARELAQATNISLTVLGGRLRAENMSTTGPLAASMLEGLWFDRLFLGASAISNDGWVTGFDSDEAYLNTCMIAQSTGVTVLADRSKFGQRAAFSATRLSSGQSLVTDTKPTLEFCEFATNAGLQTTVACALKLGADGRQQ